MTLTKSKPKRPTASHKRRTARHHKHDEHYLKAYWPYVPIVAIMLFGLVVSNFMSNRNHGVLAYATDISVSGLLSGTNDQRIANGLGSLAINGLLNNAAQAKANDMVARDYWSHNTPDGQTPWTFITNAGYLYSTAGENLAYGFVTSSGTITGWMNSPAHRANILNTSFVDVGFGIANSPNYQGSGPQTVVVAMYASPRVAPTPPPVTPAAPVIQPQAPVSSAPAPAPAAQPSETPLATNTPNEPTTEQPASPTPTSTNNTKTPQAATTAKPLPEPTEKKVPQLQLVAGNWAPSWSLFATSLIVVSGLFFVFIRHTLAWHKVLIRSERFILHHPLLDIAVVGIVTVCLLLSQTSGLIR